MRRCIPVLLVLALFAFVLPQWSYAQSALCFNVPGITNCIEGRFRTYWEQNGGLAVFGYPITPAANQTTAEGTFLTQYFERNRFELHPEKAAPYDVLLGRLGDDRLKQQGRDWFTFPKGQQNAACLWFAETGHSVCEPFRAYWESHGLQDPALNQYARSLALFGQPLSEPSMETNASGDNVLTQWFERARFEFHPNQPAEFRVLLGLLGNETRANTGPVPTPIPGNPTVVPTQPPAIPTATTAPVQPTATTAPVQPTATTPPPTATQRPAPTATQPPRANCDASYPTVCIPPPPPDLDCGDIPHRRFTVRQPDPHNFDNDNDGIGCESN